MSVLLALVMLVTGGGGPEARLALVNVVYEPERTVFLYEVGRDVGYMEFNTTCEVAAVGTWFGDPERPQVVRGRWVTVHDVRPMTVGWPWLIVVHNFSYRRVAVAVEGRGEAGRGVVGLCEAGRCEVLDFGVVPVPVCAMLFFPMVMEVE